MSLRNRIFLAVVDKESLLQKLADKQGLQKIADYWCCRKEQFHCVF